MDEINFIPYGEILKASQKREEVLREEALKQMRQELKCFFEECLEEAKRTGHTAKLWKGREFHIPDFFKNFQGEYCFPEELKKSVEEAGYKLVQKGNTNTYTVWGI